MRRRSSRPPPERQLALTPPRGCVLGTAGSKNRKAGDGQPSLDTGDHVRRSGHAVVAGVAREHAQTVRAAGRGALDVSTSARPHPRRDDIRPADRHHQFGFPLHRRRADARMRHRGRHRARADTPRFRHGGRRRRGARRRARSGVDRDRACRRSRGARPGAFRRAPAAKRRPPRPTAGSSPSAFRRRFRRPITAISGPAPSSTAGTAFAVDSFVEKPDAATAGRYIADRYLWNSGNFVFRADVMLGEIARFEPDIAEAAKAAVGGMTKDLDFLRLPAEAFAAGAEEIHRLCGDGTHRARRRGAARLRLVGRRQLERGLGRRSATTPTAMPRQAPSSFSTAATASPIPTKRSSPRWSAWTISSWWRRRTRCW